MTFKITNEARRKTDRCEYNLQCLNDEEWVKCSIEKELIEDALVINTRKWPCSCRYSLNVDDKFICTCPTRYFLYSHYAE
jgi:hypothetical protein